MMCIVVVWSGVAVAYTYIKHVLYVFISELNAILQCDDNFIHFSRCSPSPNLFGNKKKNVHHGFSLSFNSSALIASIIIT